MVNAKAILAGEVEPAELGVKALDDHTLEVKLNTPLPYFPAMTTYTTLFPAHRTTIEAHGSDWTAPGNMVSNGACTLGEVALELSRLCGAPHGRIDSTPTPSTACPGTEPFACARMNHRILIGAVLFGAG